MIHTIVVHGDLTDISFLQKTFGGKFNISYGWNLDGSRDLQKPIYQSDELLGDPVHVEIYNNRSESKRIGPEEIAHIYIESLNSPASNANFIDNCLQISATDFFAKFGKNFNPSGISGASPAAPGTKFQTSPVPKDELGPYILGYYQQRPNFETSSPSLYLSFEFGTRPDDGWPDSILNSVSIEEYQ